MQGFLAVQKRNAETGFFHRIALQLVGDAGRTASQLYTAHTHAAHQFVHGVHIRFNDPAFRGNFGKIIDIKLIRLFYFSSSVIRESRSAVRSSMERFGFL